MRSSPPPDARPLDAPPLDGRALEELALAYAARYATSAAKLEAYLVRKLRRRGWTGAGEAEGAEPPVSALDVAALVARCVSAGYVDDRGFAQARAASLLRRGYGARRIVETLSMAGIDEGLRADVMPAAGEAVRAALAMARKRRFGPWGAEPPDGPRAQKQIAAMLRAGHPLDLARALVQARTLEEAEAWADERMNESS